MRFRNYLVTSLGILVLFVMTALLSTSITQTKINQAQVDNLSRDVDLMNDIDTLRTESMGMVTELAGHSTALWKLVGKILTKQNALAAEPDWTFEQLVSATVMITRRDAVGWGSGVFIGDNVILTARHVVLDADKVVLYQGQTYEILEVVLDPDSDLAVVVTEEIGELYIAKAFTGEITLGSDVYAVGTPVHREWISNLSKGVVSHLDRGKAGISHYSSYGWDVAFGVDAWTGPGCSGGPVFIDGKVAGIYVGQMGKYAGCFALCIPVAELNLY